MNLFDLAARLSLNSDDYNKGLDDAENRADRSGKSIGAKLKNGIGNALKIAAAAGTAAISAAAAGVSAVLKQAVDSYGQYEQLVGGVETLFGTASNKVLENAKNAYSTAGLSANAYMETVTSFAASLKQSTKDEAEAADVADMAIRDMSD